MRPMARPSGNRSRAAKTVHKKTGHASGCTLRDWGLENVYDIYPQWLHRYAPGVRRNTEHLFSLQVPVVQSVVLSPREHTAWAWWPWREAADRCFSPSNAEAILLLPQFASP